MRAALAVLMLLAAPAAPVTVTDHDTIGRAKIP